MRISIDTNVLVSYLLDPFGAGSPSRAVHAAFEGSVDLFLSEAHIDELHQTIRKKRYLQHRVPEPDLTEFIERLRAVATVTPAIDSPIPSLSRDPADDYLLAHAVIEHIDYLVTGDRDLLVIGEFEGVHIVSPAEFAVLLEAGK